MCPCFAEVNDLQAFWAHHAPLDVLYDYHRFLAAFFPMLTFGGEPAAVCCLLYIHYDGKPLTASLIGGGSSWLLRRAFQVGHKKEQLLCVQQGMKEAKHEYVSFV